MNSLYVLIPKPGTAAAGRIDPGSGVVGDDAIGESIIVYFEGNRFGAVNLRRFDERVMCAAGRLAMRYPTIATGQFLWDDFEVVGTFEWSDDWKETKTRIANQPLVDAWVGAA